MHYLQCTFVKCIAITFCLILFTKHLSATINHIDDLDLALTDTISSDKKFIHRLEAEFQTGFTLKNVPFMRGENFANKKINNAFSGHLKYALQFNPESNINKIYKGSYQGVGLGHYNFGNKTELGNPTAIYLFQGAQIVRFNHSISLNYEWNFGISTGWRPYHYSTNHLNHLIGSKINAYLNAKLYFNWTLSKKIDLLTGIGVTHFSNGNTEYPNAGMNMLDAKLGLTYNLNRYATTIQTTSSNTTPLFNRHVSYDITLFGSWRRKGVNYLDQAIASPDHYMVLGGSFNPMYNVGYKIRLGAALDLVHDGSANVYAKDYIIGTEQEFIKPPISQQLAAGLSVRLEYAMPYFNLGLGHGYNILYGKGDLNSSYQIVNLKTAISRSAFINIGYSLKDFKEPNFLMLGFGYRFNNKYPSIFH